MHRELLMNSPVLLYLLYLLIPYIGVRGRSCGNTRTVHFLYAEGPDSVRGRSTFPYAEGPLNKWLIHSWVWNSSSRNVRGRSTFCIDSPGIVKGLHHIDC